MKWIRPLYLILILIVFVFDSLSVSLSLLYFGRGSFFALVTYLRVSDRNEYVRIFFF